MKTRISVKNGGVKVFDIVEIPGSSDRFRWRFSVDARVLREDSESTRSVVHFDEKHLDGVIEDGKMPVQKPVENYANA